MRKAYVVVTKRSAIGSFMGGPTSVPLVDPGATILSRTIKEAGIDPASIDEVIVGNVIAAGLGQSVGRQASIKAGVPIEVCTQSLSMLYDSGSKAVVEATMHIQYGFDDIFVADDMESIINTPYLVPSKARNGVKMGDMKMVDSMLHDGLTGGMYGIHMGVTADSIVKKYSIFREDQNALAYVSQQKAIAAADSGRFQDEVVPVEVPGRKGNVTVLDTDEYSNRASTPEKLAKLRPAFTKDGTVAAGNASGINDGASSAVIASEDTVKKHNLIPLVEVIGISQGGVDPRIMGLGPMPTILHTLKYADLCIEDMELVELGEVFAAQSLGVIHELEEATDMDRSAFMEKTNVNGGTIALGHPVDTSGDRILVSPLYEVQRRDLKIGLASLCIGDGQGATVIIKCV